MAKKFGVLWCVIHFTLEIICFQYYALFFGSIAAAALMAVIYDTLAFFPQFFIGAFLEKYPKMRAGLIGAALVLCGGICGLVDDTALRFAGFLVLSLGNAFVHVGGAEATLYTCKDKIAPSAVFVAGGAVGVITGKLLGSAGKPLIIGILAMAGGTVLMLGAEALFKKAEKSLPHFDTASPRVNTAVVVLLAFFTVSVRGLMGYGIPISWSRTWEQNLFLFCMMAVGKAVGGILSDEVGAKKTAIISAALSLPLILLGDNIMWVSLMGIALFSMTMASTLSILVSAVQGHPLMAYGVTTTGLFAGSLLVFLPNVKAFVSQGSVLTILTALSLAALWYIMNDDKKIKKG